MSFRWAVNASPVIVLARIGRVHLVTRLCRDLVIPHAVAEEIGRGPTDDPARRWLAGEGHEFVHAPDSIDPTVSAWNLGEGEGAVLAWARANPGFEAIIDDRAARTCAAVLSVPCRGTLGVILLAKQEGLLAEVSSVLSAISHAGLYIHPRILRSALELAGEQADE